MRTKREIRREAKQATYALLHVQLDAEDSGDLFVGLDDWDEEELDEFRAEVQRIMARITR